MKLDFSACTPIDKGWSGDGKYLLSDERGQRFLLRTAPEEKYGKKKAEFDWMQKAAALHIPMCKPIEIGIKDGLVYTLHSWIDGRDLEGCIAVFSKQAQYDYGIAAGQALKKLHTLPAPENLPDWGTRFSKKIDRKIAAYAACPIKYPGGEAFLRCIEKYRHLIQNRPQTFQHGDYHIGNMMLDQNNALVIIDFDRFDFGDPWEEFNRIVWCAQKSPAFASGMVDGYFDQNVPDDFWALLALYIASNTLSSLPWAIPFGQKEIDVMLAQGQEILSWYDNMTRIIPRWYRHS